MNQLKWQHFLDQMTPAFRRVLEAKTTAFNVEKGKIIYFQSDSDDSLYVVLSGYIRTTYVTYEGDIFLYSILSAGDAFGETGFHNDQGHAETASAKSNATLLKIKIQTLSEPHFQAEKDKLVANLMTDKYRQVLNITRCLLLSNLEQRLAHAILSLSKRLSFTKAYEGSLYDSIPPNITQTDLGAMIRGNRVNINRILNQWQSKNYVLLLDRSILILDPEILRDICMQSNDL